MLTAPCRPRFSPSARAGSCPTLVRDYIDSGEPVASATLTRRAGLGVSSATIRNVLAQLEDMGYVSQPHTSAGRIPTDLGYRYYVEHAARRRAGRPATR